MFILDKCVILINIIGKIDKNGRLIIQNWSIHETVVISFFQHKDQESEESPKIPNFERCV